MSMDMIGFELNVLPQFNIRARLYTVYIILYCFGEITGQTITLFFTGSG